MHHEIHPDTGEACEYEDNGVLHEREAVTTPRCWPSALHYLLPRNLGNWYSVFDKSKILIEMQKHQIKNYSTAGIIRRANLNVHNYEWL